jgi:hypothetical protein
MLILAWFLCSCVKQNGEIEEANLYNFLSDADFPSYGNRRPDSWEEAVKALRNEMTTHAVITASAHLFGLEIIIVDWRGVSIFLPSEQLC